MLALLFGVLVAGVPADTAKAPAPKVIIVRHAEKASLTESDPSLSEAGKVRAAVLDSILANSNVTAIFVTPYKRTRETAAGVAARHKLTPTALSPANIPAYAKALADSIATKTGVILVISHSNTIPSILEALGGKKIPELCEPAFSHLFTVVPKTADGPATVIPSRYGAKDPVDADKCAASGMKN